MKTITLFILCFLATFYTSQGQSFNKEIHPNTQKAQLIGKVNKDAFLKDPYSTWFDKNYNQYQPDQSTITTLKDTLPHYTFELFMGTWCGDSKRETPRIYKVLEQATVPLDRLTTITVNKGKKYKQSPGGEHEGKNIHRVPTLIVYQNGVEINRIVESPVQSIEKDLQNIINQNYTSNYELVTLTHTLIQEEGVNKFKKRIKKHARNLKPFARASKELNTYAYLLSTQNKADESLAAHQLNTILFPESSYSNLKLANYYFENKAYKKAKSHYEKTLVSSPENKEAKEMLIKLEEID